MGPRPSSEFAQHHVLLVRERGLWRARGPVGQVIVMDLLRGASKRDVRFASRVDLFSFFFFLCFFLPVDS